MLLANPQLGQHDKQLLKHRFRNSQLRLVAPTQVNQLCEESFDVLFAFLILFEELEGGGEDGVGEFFGEEFVAFEDGGGEVDVFLLAEGLEVSYEDF